MSPWKYLTTLRKRLTRSRREDRCQTKPRRVQLGFESFECRIMPAILTPTIAATPVMTTATVRTLDAATVKPASLDASVDRLAKYSADQLRQLDKGLQAVEMIAHLSDLFGLMAGHLNKGAGVSVSLDTGASPTSVSTTVANLFAQMQQSMSSANFTDLIKQIGGPAAPPPTLPGTQKLAQSSVTKAFQAVAADLAELGIRDARFVMNGGSGSGGCFGTFVKVPGSSGDGWSFLLSAPGLKQADTDALLNQWKSGLDPRTADWLSEMKDATNAAVSCISDYVTIGGFIGGGLGGPEGALVVGGIGFVVGAEMCKDKYNPPPPTTPNKSMPVADGSGPQAYDPAYAWENPWTFSNLVDPVEDGEKATFDAARFTRGLITLAVSRVNPSPVGSTGGSSTSGVTPVGATPVGGLGGDPADDQPIVHYDTTAGGNPILLFFPPAPKGSR